LTPSTIQITPQSKTQGLGPWTPVNVEDEDTIVVEDDRKENLNQHGRRHEVEIIPGPSELIGNKLNESSLSME
jgi:hypothetical protein